MSAIIIGIGIIGRHPLDNDSGARQPNSAFGRRHKERITFFLKTLLKGLQKAIYPFFFWMPRSKAKIEGSFVSSYRPAAAKDASCLFPNVFSVLCLLQLVGLVRTEALFFLFSFLFFLHAVGQCILARCLWDFLGLN